MSFLPFGCVDQIATLEARLPFFDAFTLFVHALRSIRNLISVFHKLSNEFFNRLDYFLYSSIHISEHPPKSQMHVHIIIPQ